MSKEQECGTSQFVYIAIFIHLTILSICLDKEQECWTSQFVYIAIYIHLTILSICLNKEQTRMLNFTVCLHCNLYTFNHIVNMS